MIFKRRRRNKFAAKKFSVQLADQKTRYRWWQRLLFWLVIIGVAALFWYLFLSGSFAVKEVIVEGANVVPVEQIEGKVSLKNKNILLLDTEEPERQIASILEIKNATLIRILPSTVKVVVSERVPTLIWETTDQRFAVDNGGIPYKEAGESVEGLYSVIDTANIHVDLGSQLVPRSFVVAYLTLVPDLQEIYQDQLSHFEVGETVYDLDAIITDGRRVKLNILSNVSSQLAELKRIALERPDLFSRNVVDLRVDRWAYIQ